MFLFLRFLRDYIIDYKCEIFHILCYENIEFILISHGWIFWD
jgi:hypothetical protein